MISLNSKEQRENETKNYKLYKHTSPSNKVYIGITKQEPCKRWGGGCGYKGNTYFWRAIQKYGWNNFEHELICDGLTKEEAERLEIAYISKYDSTNRDKGYNKSPGGHILPEISDETRRKMSENHADFRYGNSSKAKTVYQYDKLSGEYIAEYSSVTEAADTTGIDRECIAGAARGKHKTAGGYRWSYEKVDALPSYKYVPESAIRLYMYDLDGKYIGAVDSIMDARKLYNAHLRSEFFLQTDVRQSGGFQWTIKKFASVPPHTGRKVYVRHNTNIKEDLLNGKQD